MSPDPKAIQWIVRNIQGQNSFDSFKIKLDSQIPVDTKKKLVIWEIALCRVLRWRVMSSIVKTIDIGSVGEWGVEHGYLTTADIRGQYSNKSVVVASLSNEGTTTPEDIMSEYFSSDPIYWSALQPSPNSLPRLQNYKTQTFFFTGLDAVKSTH